MLGRWTVSLNRTVWYKYYDQFFSFPAQWYWLDDYQRRLRLLSGEGQVKVELRSGKEDKTLKLIFLHKKDICSMQLITGTTMVVLVLLYVVKNAKNIKVWTFDVINFEQFFSITLPKIQNWHVVNRLIEL